MKNVHYLQVNFISLMQSLHTETQEKPLLHFSLNSVHKYFEILVNKTFFSVHINFRKFINMKAVILLGTTYLSVSFERWHVLSRDCWGGREVKGGNEITCC